MEVQGKIKLIGETKIFGNNGFRKREIVITTEEQYPQYIMIEFIQDKCDLLDSYKVGKDVKISINLRGREWVNPEGETKYFNSIQGWRIENTLSVDGGENIPPVVATEDFESTDNLNEDKEDDFPF